MIYFMLRGIIAPQLPSKQPKVEPGGTESREMQTETVALLQVLSYLSCIT